LKGDIWIFARKNRVLKEEGKAAENEGIPEEG